MEALSPPKQERATASGMVQFITPNTLSANVWEERRAFSELFKSKKKKRRSCAYHGDGLAV